MRRPAPLPAPVDPPAQDAATPRDGDRRPAPRGRSGPSAPEPATPARRFPAHAEPPVPEEGPSADTSAADPSSADPSAVSAVPAFSTRTGDVWRAANARRRALRAEIRRFTQRSRRRRLAVWGGVGVVVALVLGSVLAAYSPLFAVREITVAGAKSLDPAAVEQVLEPQLGSPLALVDRSAVKSALTGFPVIESYALEARPPHELLVRIVERTPIGVIESDAGFSLVDAAGVVLATTEEQPEDAAVLIVSGGVGSPAFRAAGLVMRSLPADLRADVRTVRATSGDDVTLALSDGRNVVWGSEEDSARKAAVLVRLMAAAPDARTFDVSSPSVPVVG